LAQGVFGLQDFANMKSAIAQLLLLGQVLAFPQDCPNVTVIHDVVGDKWYDSCLGLDEKPKANTAAACEAQCKADVQCSVWQLLKHDGAKGLEKGCWSGNVVHGCRSRGDDGKLRSFEKDLEAGQRLQHGFIKVVSTNVKMETMGLLHYPETTGTEPEQIERCKQYCYTGVTCTVWQFGKDGCWVEHGPKNLKEKAKNDSDWAKGMIAGETIEHTCPPYVAPDGLPWPWIIAGIVLGVLALAAILYALLKKTPKTKKTRAVKIEPKPEPVPIFIPQPTVMMMAPQYAPQYTVLR